MNGTLLFGSESNEMFRNIISNNDYGIRVVAYNNTVYGNLIENNQRGMYFCCGISGNIMYLNSFKGNKLYHAADYLPNQWDSGTLGNYWDDFDEADEGAYDNNGDGIVDEPYSIVGESNVDRFPLMESTWY
jgi:parallel beta-helix repeat protein